MVLNIQYVRHNVSSVGPSHATKRALNLWIMGMGSLEASCDVGNIMLAGLQKWASVDPACSCASNRSLISLGSREFSGGSLLYYTK